MRLVPDQLGGAAGVALPVDGRPDLVSVRAGAHNLPLALSAFVGRRQDLVQVAGLVSTSPMVTVTGPTGMGKTRLVIEVATRLAAAPFDGVWLVELALIEPTEDAERVAQAVASVLDVRTQPGQSFTEALVSRLRRAEAMILLDNCEHLTSAAASFAGKLLAGCPGLSFLASSQCPLGLPGEQVWPLGPLSLPESALAGAASDAVALFHARAKAINPAFVVTEEGAAAVADTCRRLDGIPLAIELAAARCSVLSPTEIAEHLGERFRFLTTGSRSSAPRHQTLQAALDWSWDLLAPAEKALLRRLSVFAGGAGLGDIWAVCTGGEVAREAVLDLLSALVSKSLVAADTARSRARYRLLETVRAYGRARLDEADETGAFKELHAHWYLETAENVWHQRMAGNDHEGSDRLEAEHDNLRAALGWFIAEGDGQAALRMGFALTPFWKARGHLREGREWLELALSLGEDTPPAVRVRATWGVGLLSLLQGDLDRASSSLEESLTLARQQGYERPAVEAINLLAFISVFTKDPTTALPLLQESVEWARAHRDNGSLLTALALFGRAHLLSGDLTAAEAVFGECREIGRSIGKGSGSKGLVGLGWVALSRGQHDKATHLLTEVLPILRREDDRFETALALSFLGELAWRRGDDDEAHTVLEEGMELARAMGTPFPLARCLLGLGRLAHGNGDGDTAVRLVEEAVEAARQARFPHILVRCLVTRAELCRAHTDLDGARSHLDEALAIATENGDRAGMALALRPLGALARIRGDYQAAASLYLEGLELQSGTGELGGMADTLDNLAGLSVAQERPEHGGRLLGAAHGLRLAAGSMRSPMDGPDHDVDTALVRSALDVDQFEQAFGRGAALSAEEAVALASRSRAGRKRPAKGWASLTPAERQVVDLVAEGLTNPEVGERMFLSPRTVQSHLARAFRKVGVSTRRQLREALHSQQ